MTLLILTYLTQWLAVQYCTNLKVIGRLRTIDAKTNQFYDLRYMVLFACRGSVRCRLFGVGYVI